MVRIGSLVARLSVDSKSARDAALHGLDVRS
jgi:hypothetical protein